MHYDAAHGGLVTAQRMPDHVPEVGGMWSLTGWTVVIVIGEQTQVQ